MRRIGLAFTVILLFAGLSANQASAELPKVATAPGGLTVAVDGTSYPAPVTFDWPAGSLHTLDAPSPRVAGDSLSRASFAAGSDGGAQSHSVTMPPPDTTNTASSATQYLLDTAITPSEAGTVTNDPIGPWYDAGQLVSS